MKVQILFKQLMLPILVFLLAVCSQAAAGRLLVNGNWDYSDAKNSDDQFEHFYGVTYSGSADLTDLTELSGSIRYQHSIFEDNTQDVITPSLNLTNENDIYRFTLNGNLNYYRTDDDTDRDNWNWNSRLASNWRRGLLLPSYSVYYGQSHSSGDQVLDSEKDRAGGRVSWGHWNWLRLLYSIDWNENRVEDTGRKNETTRQLATLNITKSFLNNRGHFSFTQSYQDLEQESTVTAGAGVPLLLSEASALETTDPVTGALTTDVSFLLTDVASGEPPPLILDINPLLDPMNLGVRVNFQQVNEIHLITRDDISTYANDFDWDLYSSNDGTNWNLEVASPAYTYNIIQKRFEFNVSLSGHRYIKLVADTSTFGLLVPPNPITAIEGLELFRDPASPGAFSDITNSETHGTQLGMGFDLTRNMNFSYNYSYTKREIDFSPRDEQTSHSASLTWLVNEYLSARLNASESKDELGGIETDKARNYTLSVSSEPLRTLSVGLAASRTENYELGERQTVFHSYNVYTVAQLYRDLEASWDLGYRTVEQGTGSDGFNSNLRLTARLSPVLFLSLDQNYNRNVDTGTDSYDNTLRMNWRVSDILSLSSNLQVYWVDNNDPNSQFSLSAGIAPNKKHRISLTYLLLDDENRNTQSLGANWNWIITRVFTFNLSSNYVFDNDDESDWSFLARLSAWYSTR